MERCGKCDSCQIERIGCGCDGAYDDGCFLCRPSLHERPPCPLSDAEELARLQKEHSELESSLPRCCFSHECENIGVKWIARTHLHCDTHGSIYDQDTPWAEYARRKGLAGKHGSLS